MSGGGSELGTRGAMRGYPIHGIQDSGDSCTQDRGWPHDAFQLSIERFPCAQCDDKFSATLDIGTIAPVSRHYVWVSETTKA